MLKLRNAWETLRGSLWFVPTLIVAGAVALAVGLIEIDAAGFAWKLADHFPRLFGAGAASSRGLLAAIAGSMITVAGTTFSITIVALAQASSQYTSRILRNFMRDRASQSVLGVFVGVFAYCLIVLRTIRGGDEGIFVPSLSVLVGLILALVAIGFLIFFIHHIAASFRRRASSPPRPRRRCGPLTGCSRMAWAKPPERRRQRRSSLICSRFWKSSPGGRPTPDAGRC